MWWAYQENIDLSSRGDRELKLESTKALGSQLEMTKHMINKVITELFSVDVPKTGHPTVVVGFCLYVHLFNKATEQYEDRTQALYWESSPGKGAIFYPSPDKPDNDDAFQRVADSFIDFYSDVTQRVLQSILQRLSQGGLPEKREESQPTVEELVSK